MLIGTFPLFSLMYETAFSSISHIKKVFAWLVRLFSEPGVLRLPLRARVEHELHGARGLHWTRGGASSGTVDTRRTECSICRWPSGLVRRPKGFREKVPPIPDVCCKTFRQPRFFGEVSSPIRVGNVSPPSPFRTDARGDLAHSSGSDHKPNALRCSTCTDWTPQNFAATPP